MGKFEEWAIGQASRVLVWLVCFLAGGATAIWYMHKPVTSMQILQVQQAAKESSDIAVEAEHKADISHTVVAVQAKMLPLLEAKEQAIMAALPSVVPPDAIPFQLALKAKDERIEALSLALSSSSVECRELRIALAAERQSHRLDTIAHELQIASLRGSLLKWRIGSVVIGPAIGYGIGKLR